MACSPSWTLTRHAQVSFPRAVLRQRDASRATRAISVSRQTCRRVRPVQLERTNTLPVALHAFRAQQARLLLRTACRLARRGALARKALAAALKAPTPVIVFAPRARWARLTRPQTAATRACRSAAPARRATASWQPPLRPPTAHAPHAPRDNSRAAPPTRSARSGRRAPRARACRAPALLLPTAAAPRAMSARPTRLRTTATRAPA